MEVNSISPTVRWTGRILKGLICLFLLVDAVMKIILHSKSTEGTVQLGLPVSCVPYLGAYLLLATILYMFPRTYLYGILFIVAYLGGAAAIGYAAKPGTTGFLFPVTFAVFVCMAEFLMNNRFRIALSLK